MDHIPTVRDLAGLDPRALETLRASLAPVRTLADVLDWARSRHPPATIDQIVTQDEFTHDVVLPLGDRWIAFDVT
jgi:hypothetical protein